MDLSERIRFVRQFRGMTQTELAERIGLSADENGRIRISQYENGVTPKPEMLKKMSEALNVSSSYLSSPNKGTSIVDFIFSLIDQDKFINVNIIKNKDTEHYSIDFNNHILNRFFSEWFNMKKDFEDGKITEEEYIEWTFHVI